ncbi:hypothetical protein CBL_09046 [Carabus blaptoides fortunei]
MRLLLCLTLALCLGDILAYPTQFPNDVQIEDRRRKHKRKKRPCPRQDASSARWFWGHDLTLILGDVTLVTGDNPCHGSDAEIAPDKPLFSDHRPGIFGGQKPDEDEQQEQYRPGTLVGAPSAQISGHGQDLTNFSPSGIFSEISRHFNRIVDPFIDLFV